MSSPATEATHQTNVMLPWLSQAVGPLLYGVRLATAVALALFIAFTLQLDNPSWAGTSAAIVCQPILRSSLRKAFFRAIGTVVGATVAVVLLSPQFEHSGPAAVGFGIGTVAAACLAAVTNFVLLPNREGLLSLALVMGAVLVPVAALSTVPALAPYLVATFMNFVPLLGPTNVISFDTASFYNAALAIVVGCLAGAAALVVIPPIPARTRAARLVALTMRDLRRMASGRRTPSPAAWQNLVYARLVAMPEGVEGSFPSHLVATLTFGLQVLRLQGASGQGSADVAAGLRAVARSDLHGMGVDFDRADATLTRTAADPRSGDVAALRVRTAIQLIRDVVRQHPGTFEGATS